MDTTFLLEYGNLDSTNQINLRMEHLGPGILSGGALSGVSGLLKVAVADTTVLSKTGMVAKLENVSNVTVTDGVTQYIMAVVKYITGDSASAEVIALATSSYAAYADKDYSIILGTVDLSATGYTEVTSSEISYEDREDLEGLFRSSFRGVYASTGALPAYSLASPTSAKDGDLAYVTGVGFYKYDLSSGAWFPVSSTVRMFVRNTTGSAIAANKLVSINDWDTSRNAPKIELWDANDTATSGVPGVTEASISNTDYGYVAVRGPVSGFDTSSYTAGDYVYGNYATPGSLSSSSRGLHPVRLGVVLYSHASNGVILLDPVYRRAPVTFQRSYDANSVFANVGTPTVVEQLVDTARFNAINVQYDAVADNGFIIMDQPDANLIEATTIGSAKSIYVEMYCVPEVTDPGSETVAFELEYATQAIDTNMSGLIAGMTSAGNSTKTGHNSSRIFRLTWEFNISNVTGSLFLKFTRLTNTGTDTATSGAVRVLKVVVKNRVSPSKFVE